MCEFRISGKCLLSNSTECNFPYITTVVDCESVGVLWLARYTEVTGVKATADGVKKVFRRIKPDHSSSDK